MIMDEKKKKRKDAFRTVYLVVPSCKDIKKLKEKERRAYPFKTRKKKKKKNYRDDFSYFCKTVKEKKRTKQKRKLTICTEQQEWTTRENGARRKKKKKIQGQMYVRKNQLLE